jgi:3-methylcrotonyl-CoA carboxylase alpha subunit
MLKKLLIANRGEIARRIIRTARAMGIRTVAVYADADAKSLHVRDADEAVYIGASPATDSYLRIDKLIAAAKATGADAIHPGYGFLSENADLPDACVKAGITFVGPRAEAMRALGGKAAAKDIAIKAGVPVVPGYQGRAQDLATLTKEAKRIGYPVMIKAVAGGGGRGMRLVEKEGDFAELFDSAKREATSSFGNPDVLVEKVVVRCSATPKATLSICLSATARCSAATRKLSRKRRRLACQTRCGPRCVTQPLSLPSR